MKKSRFSTVLEYNRRQVLSFFFSLLHGKQKLMFLFWFFFSSHFFFPEEKHEKNAVFKIGKTADDKIENSAYRSAWSCHFLPVLFRLSFTKARSQDIISSSNIRTFVLFVLRLTSGAKRRRGKWTGTGSCFLIIAVSCIQNGRKKRPWPICAY